MIDVEGAEWYKTSYQYFPGSCFEFPVLLDAHAHGIE